MTTNAFRYILRTQKKVILWMIISFVLFFLTQSVSLLVPGILRKTVDIYIPRHDMTMIWKMIALIILIPVVGTGLNMIYNYLLAFYGRKYSQELTNIAVQKVLSQPLKYFRNKNSAEVASFCKGESYKAITILLFDIPQMAAKIIVGIVLLVMLARISFWFLGIGIIGIGLSILPSNYLAGLTKKYIPTIITGNAKMNQILSDSFREIVTIKAFQMEDIQVRKVGKINKTIMNVWAKTAMLDSLNGIWNGGLINSLFYGIVFGAGVSLSVKEVISIGGLIESLGYITRLFDVTSTIASVNLNYKKTVAELEPLLEILLLQETEKSNGFLKVTTDPCKVAFNNISFGYGNDSERLLQDISITIAPGEWIGIEGESGAGKTSFLYMLEKFHDPTKGNITIDGKNIADISIDTVRSLITYVPQAPFLFAGTIRENLDPYGSGISDKEMWDVLEKLQLRKTIETREGGLDAEVGEKGLMLSGGEAQRIVFARGLLRDTPILLLDEITSSVDEETENIIVELLKEKMKEDKKTIISISHRTAFHQHTSATYRVEAKKMIRIK